MSDLKTAIIKICPESKGEQISLETNGVSKLEIMDLLQVLMHTLAGQMVDEARKHVGDDDEAQARWIDLQRQKPNQN